MNNRLEREKKIDELESKITALANFGMDEDLDLEKEISRLKRKVAGLRVDNLRDLGPWDKVSLARLRGRPTALDYIEDIFTDYMEFHGDRAFGEDASIVGGIARLAGRPVTVVAQQKGRDTEESIRRNFGMTRPEGYRKALRLMKQAEKFGRPVICLVDTPGAFCGIEAEERGQGQAIAENLMEMSLLEVPVISTVIGEGGSGGALALAVADRVNMLENSIYSILSPEGFASILWKDSTRAQEASEIMRITAEDLKELGIIDQIVPEPLGGAQKDREMASGYLREQLESDMKELLGMPTEELLDKRYQRFRRYGLFGE